jgi:hypothetical protein
MLRSFVLVGLVGVAASWVGASRASADSVIGTRFEVAEEAHRVEARLDRGFATLVVQRVVLNDGPRSDQATFYLDLPEGAVATRLRTAGIDAAGHPVWFEGDLLDAEEAAAKYQELTGLGGYYPKDPALLSWRHRGNLALQVFPVPPRAKKTVEYTLLMPMAYADGKYSLELPILGTEELRASVRVSAVHEEDRVTVNGVPLAEGFAVEASRALTFELRPGGGPHLMAALAAVPLQAKRAFVHARATAAPHIAETPAHAAVAVVLDVSRSMGGRTGAEVAAARAYLTSFHDAEVTVLAFDRRVTLPFGKNLPVSDVLVRLQSYEPKASNGSQLDDALARADLILSHASSASRRIVVMTDFLTREALTPERLAALRLSSGAIVHLASIEEGAANVARDDDSPWAALPRKTGGLFWNASASAMNTAARETFEEWARPKRLDHVHSRGFPEGFEVPEVLNEGQDIEYLGVAESKPTELVLEGELWSTPTRISAASSPDEERRWSALIFGSPESDLLPEAEQRILASKGRAVSPVTSYLAIEPGVRPSTEGLEPNEGFGEGGGGQGFGVGLGRIGSIGHGSGVSTFDPQHFLESTLTQAWKACGGVGRADLKLESTRDEVVEVTLALPGEPAAACLTEAAWSLDLPPQFISLHQTWAVPVES